MQQFLESLDNALKAVLDAPKGRDFVGSTPAAVDPGRLLWTAAQHTCLLGAAKRARPRLVHLFAQALEADAERTLSVAVCAELIHAASLVHDDVIDEGTVRRGAPTVNAKWDNLTAVLSGDLMLSLGFQELHRETTPVLLSAVEVLREMSCAAIEEAQARGQLDLPKAMWEEIAVGKTGALFGWCGLAVGMIAERPDVADRFNQAGRKLGIAFQLADDLKDVLLDDGKDRYADLKNQNPSYPMLWAAHHGHPIAKDIAELWSRDDAELEHVRQVGDALASSDIVPVCMEHLASVIEDALGCLGPERHTASGREIEKWALRLGVIEKNPMLAAS